MHCCNSPASLDRHNPIFQRSGCWLRLLIAEERSAKASNKDGCQIITGIEAHLRRAGYLTGVLRDELPAPANWRLRATDRGR